MYVNKCSKCGSDFETKNPKRVICPNCLYPDRASSSSVISSSPESANKYGGRPQQDQPDAQGERDQSGSQNREDSYQRGSYNRDSEDRQGGGGRSYGGGGGQRGYGDRQGGYGDRQGGGGSRPYGGGGGQRSYGDRQGGYGDRQGGGSRPYGGGGGQRSYGDRQGGYGDRQGGGGSRPYGGGGQRSYGDRQGGGGSRPYGGGGQRSYGDRQGGGGSRPYGGGGQRSYGDRQGGGSRPYGGGGQRSYGGQGGAPRPYGGGGGQRGGFNRGPQRPGGRPPMGVRRGGPVRKLLVTKEQLFEIEKLYKAMLPLPNPDSHEVIGQKVEMEPQKVFFGINLIRQKMFLPKLPYPKRRLAVTVEQLAAVESLYQPLLPLPPIGCHKFIAKQLKMDEWRVHVAIGIIRKQMDLPRWNPDREDAPEEFKNQPKEEKDEKPAKKSKKVEKAEKTEKAEKSEKEEIIES